MDEERYRIFMAVAAVATTLTFLVKFGPDGEMLAGGVASVWSAATRRPWLALGLGVPVVAGMVFGVVRWLDER